MADGLILLFEDDDGVAEFYRDCIPLSGYRVQHYWKPSDFLKQAADVQRLLDESLLVLTDGDMPGMHGLELIRTLRTDHDYKKPAIYNSGRLAEKETAELEAQQVTLRDGSQIALVNRALVKPVGLRTLISTIEAVTAPKP